MITKAQVVIIGGGVSGASIAYQLAKKGVKDIVIIEKGYQGCGSTSRCGAGIRQQWGTKMNCQLAKLANDYFENAAEELQYGQSLEFKQGGYLMLATSDGELAQFKKNIALQHSLGIDSQLLSLDEALKIVPFLNTKGVVGASYYEKDGHLNPFKTVDAFLRAAKRLGVYFYPYTEVTEIDVDKQRVVGVKTSAGYIATPNVVNAAGAYSHRVGQMVGLDLPTYAERHQILVTAATKPILKPMVMSFTKNIYAQQVPHGSIVMGRNCENEPRDFNYQSSAHFLETMAKTVVDLLPPLGDLRVVRTWAGQYNLTPDKQPILGEVDGIDGYYLAVGFSGHGFMMSPATGIIMSEIITGQATTVDVSMLSLKRFDTGALIIEPSVV